MRTMHVTFPLPKCPGEEHRLSWRADDGSSASLYDDIVPEYQFFSTDARRVFQGDVRDRDLVGSFDTQVIWTDRTESRHDRRESYGQDLKIWRCRGEDRNQCSLSFNVTNGPCSNRHAECELRRLGPTARTGVKDPHVVYLDFIDGDRDSQSSAAAEDIPGSPTGPPQKKKRGLSGIFSRSPVGPKPKKRMSQGSIHLVPGEDFFANLRYLAVELSDTEDSNGRVVEAASQGKFAGSMPIEPNYRLLLGILS